MANPQPHNREAEEALISRVLSDPGIFMTLDVEANDFYIHRHKWIWSAFERMTRRQVGIDFVTLGEELDRMGRWAEIGKDAGLAEFVGRHPIGMDPDATAKIVRNYAQRRALLVLAGDIAKAAHDKNNDIEAEIGVFIDALVRSGRVVGGAEHWRKFINELYDEIGERAEDPKEIWGIPTGFTVFDRVTGGLQPSESLILSGSPGVGKSMWAMQVAEQMADHSPGAIYSLEMKGKSVMRRIVSAQAGVTTRALKTGKVEDRDWPVINEAIEQLDAKDVYMSDATGWTTTSLRADLARLKAMHGIEWFVFDYMLLANDAPSLNEIERTAMISRNMKLLCRHLELAGVVIHSMNKAGIEANVPGQQNLRGSGQVSYDADLICFLTEFRAMSPEDDKINDKDRDNMRTLIFGKGRELEDPRKYIHMVKKPHYPQFGDYEPEANAQRL